MPGMDEEAPPLAPPPDCPPPELPPELPPDELLEEPPDEPPLEPEEPPDDPDDPPLDELGEEGMDEEEDCCWLAQPPISKAERELMATQWAAIVSSRCDESDDEAPDAGGRVD